MVKPRIRGASVPAVGAVPPQLTQEKLDAWQDYVSALAEGVLKDILQRSLTAILAWWNAPESQNRRIRRFPYRRLRDGKEVTLEVQPLDEKIVNQIDEAVPWSYELDAMLKQVELEFKERPVSKEERDMTYEMLWFTYELSLDREPCTADRFKE